MFNQIFFFISSKEKKLKIQNTKKKKKRTLSYVRKYFRSPWSMKFIYLKKNQIF